MTVLKAVLSDAEPLAGAAVTVVEVVTLAVAPLAALCTDCQPAPW